MPETVILEVKRQKGPRQKPWWEEFEVPYSTGMNVITALQEIQKNPRRRDGTPTTPVAWQACCLEEVCGACTMIINGEVRQACSALVSELKQPIRLQPMTKFPLIRDLAVDRQRMFDTLIRVKAWVPIDGTYDLGPGPKMASSKQLKAYVLSTCMTCGCCLEVCPEFRQGNDFVGAFAISQVRLFNTHPTGEMHKEGRLDALMEPGGVSDCGNAQNCVRACPKEIPLLDSIGEIGRQTTIHSLKKLLWP